MSRSAAAMGALLVALAFAPLRAETPDHSWSRVEHLPRGTTIRVAVDDRAPTVCTFVEANRVELVVSDPIVRQRLPRRVRVSIERIIESPRFSVFDLFLGDTKFEDEQDAQRKLRGAVMGAVVGLALGVVAGRGQPGECRSGPCDGQGQTIVGLTMTGAAVGAWASRGPAVEVIDRRP